MANAGNSGRTRGRQRVSRSRIQIVTVADVPEGYEERLIEMATGRFARLRLFVLDPYDLVLSKLTRTLEVDAEDAKHIIHSLNLDLTVLETRYKQELRPYVAGPVERHDQTMQLWLDAAREERNRRPR